MIKLALRTLWTFLIGAVALSLCLFLPAGTLHYWQAWLFIGVFLCSANAIGLYLWFRDPVLLERRKRVWPGAEGGETQKVVASFIGISCVALLAVCGLDRRFAWSRVPAVASLAGDVLVVLGLFIAWLVLRVNRFAGSTIETASDQRVISTGPYALVRHPMYAGNVVMLAGVPLALGSWWGFAVVALAPALLVLRILDEERLLENQLPGYREYESRVRYRLVRGVW